METEKPPNPAVFSDDDSFSEDVERNVRRKSRISALNRPKNVLADPEKYQEHYNSCIKLASENKINHKNAFSLYLIDYLKDKLKDVGQGAFQVVSSSLDAGAKIYAGRVDAVHQETYQVLTGLGKPSTKKNQENAVDSGDDEGENPEGSPSKNLNDEQGTGSKKVRKRNLNQKPVICKNLNKIRSRGPIASTDIDPLFQHQAASFDEGGSSCLKLNKTPTCNNLGELFLDSNTSAFSSGLSIPAAQHNPEEPFVFTQLCEPLFKLISDKPLTNMAHDFHFIQRPDDDKNQTFLNQTQSKDSIVGGDYNKMDYSDNDDYIEDVVDDYPMDNEPIEGLTTEALYRPNDGSPSSYKENIINSIVNTNNTFFNATGITENCLDLVNDIKSLLHDRMDCPNKDITNMLGLWAGPKYWQKKIKKFTKEVNKKPQKNTNSKAKKRDKYLRYEDSRGSEKFTKSGKVPLINFHDCGLKVSSDDKKLESLTLSEKTIEQNTDQWYVLDLDQTTLPPAEVYQRGVSKQSGDSVNFDINAKIYQTMSRNINFTLVTSRKSRLNDQKSKEENGLVLVDLSRNFRTGDNLNERENNYEDDDNDLFDDYADHGDGSFHEPMLNADEFAVPIDDMGTQGTAPFGTNLYTQEDGAMELMDNPQNINKLNIDYAKHAKVINIRKIKTLTWDCLKSLPDDEQLTEKKPATSPIPVKQQRLDNSADDADKTVEGETGPSADQDPPKEKVNEQFITLVDFLMRNLDNKTTAQISCSLMFNSLLHLANEKNLFIMPNNFTDLLISRCIPDQYRSDIEAMIQTNIDNTLTNSKNVKRRQTIMEDFFDD